MAVTCLRAVLMASVWAAAAGVAAAQTAQPAATQVDEVVVTASTREQSVAQAPATISVVTAEQLRNRAVADLTDAIRDVEGVSVSGGSNNQDILIRGLPGHYTLILVDGRRQSTRDARINGNAGFEQGFIPPVSAIERIEVVRGPMSSLYGSDAIGGVINIITRKTPDRWGGSFGADYVIQERDENGDWGQAQFYLSGPVVADTLGLQLWGRYYDRQEDSIFNAPNSTGANGSEDHNLTGRLAWIPAPGHEVLLQADTANIRRTLSAGGSAAPAAADSYLDNSRDSASLSWNGNWSWGSSALSLMREVAQRETYSRNGTGSFVRQARAPEITNTVLDGLFHVPLGDHNLVLGGQFIENSLIDQNPGRRDDIDATFEVWQRALFAEAEWRLTPELALTTGLRMDDHERYGDHWSPRLYAVWNAAPGLVLKGGVSTGFRAPEIRQVAEGYAYTTGGATCTYGPNGTCGVIIGDPDISPETSVNYELTALWTATPDLSFSATVFRTDFEDKIDSAQVLNGDGSVARWDEDPNYQLWYWYNLEDARIQGVELSARWRATDRLALRGGYTFTDSEQLTGDYEGLPLARTPEHMANLRADFEATPALNLWAAANYHGEEINAQLRSGVNGEPIGVGSARRYPDYATLDIGANWRVRDNLSLKFGVYNLADKTLDVATYDFQGEGRRGWIGFNVDF